MLSGRAMKKEKKQEIFRLVGNSHLIAFSFFSAIHKWDRKSCGNMKFNSK